MLLLLERLPPKERVGAAVLRLDVLDELLPKERVGVDGRLVVVEGRFIVVEGRSTVVEGRFVVVVGRSLPNVRLGAVVLDVLLLLPELKF